jgi:hypothetical protein
MTHDRLWTEHARRALRASGFRVACCDITRWTFEDGPIVRGLGTSPLDRLQTLIAAGEPGAIAARAGLLIEEIADNLSVAFAVKVARKAGDRYTIGDLWPSVLSRLRRTDAEDEAGKLDALVYMRNLVAAHHNQPAQELSLAEASEFAERVAALLRRVQCEHCGDWISRRGQVWACRCGATVVAPTTT